MTHNAPAKINIFLKVTGSRGNYHEIISRFVKLRKLHDTLSFIPSDAALQSFTLEGDFNCLTEQNTIYKAYMALQKHRYSAELEDFFKTHKIVVDKHIPSFAGLGGGSSDAATFMKMCNRYLSLGYSSETLADIGSSVGADIPFFIYEYDTANVEGIGEIVTPFEEQLPQFETFTPESIACDTVAVFKNYRKKFYDPISETSKASFKEMTTAEALTSLDIYTANDLYRSACDLYPNLDSYATPGRFFSGSGSTFFSIKDTHG